MTLRRAILLTAAICLLTSAARADEERRFRPGRHGPAVLRYVEHIPVLEVYGTPAQMGDQAGRLLDAAATEVVRTYLGKALPGPLRAIVLKQARKMEPHIPEAYRTEMRAFARASKLTYEDLLILNTFGDIKKWVRCTTIAVDRERSAEGTPLFGRNFDFPALGVAQHYGLVVVYHPKGKRAFAAITHPGLIGTHSFLNEAGLAGSVMEVPGGKPRFSTEAMPALMLYRRIAETSETVDAGLALVEKGPRCSSNNLMLVEASGKARLAEFTVSQVAVRAPKDGLLFGTNHHRAPGLGTTSHRCPRMRYLLSEAAAQEGRWTADAIQSHLKRTAQGQLNIFSILFFPERRSFRLATGKLPAAEGPFVTFGKDVLFRRGVWRL